MVTSNEVTSQNLILNFLVDSVRVSDNQISRFKYIFRIILSYIFSYVNQRILSPSKLRISFFSYYALVGILVQDNHSLAG